MLLTRAPHVLDACHSCSSCVCGAAWGFAASSGREYCRATGGWDCVALRLSASRLRLCYFPWRNCLHRSGQDARRQCCHNCRGHVRRTGVSTLAAASIAARKVLRRRFMDGPHPFAPGPLGWFCPAARPRGTLVLSWGCRGRAQGGRCGGRGGGVGGDRGGRTASGQNACACNCRRCCSGGKMLALTKRNSCSCS